MGFWQLVRYREEDTGYRYSCSTIGWSDFWRAKWTRDMLPQIVLRPHFKNLAFQCRFFAGRNRKASEHFSILFYSVSARLHAHWSTATYLCVGFWNSRKCTGTISLGCSTGTISLGFSTGTISLGCSTSTALTFNISYLYRFRLTIYSNSANKAMLLFAALWRQYLYHFTLR